jgi:hypothetical protein
MIKVICIENGCASLTTNKVYDAKLVELTEKQLFEWGGELYRIINDDGYSMEYNTGRFITLAEWREKQIKIVLDD